MHTINRPRIEFDPDKRAKTLLERGLDFARVNEVFGGLHFTAQDLRVEYGEARFITVGMLDARMVVIVWTPRGDSCRVISMRKANEREEERYAETLGRSG